MGKLGKLREGIEALGGSMGVSQDMMSSPESFDPEVAAMVAIAGAIGRLSEGMGEASTKQERRLRAVIRAHLNMLKEAMEGLAERNQAALEAVLEKLAQQDNSELIAALEGLKQEQKPVRFDIERDQKGFLKSVTATPIN